MEKKELSTKVILHIGDKPAKIKALQELLAPHYWVVQFPNWETGYAWLRQVDFSVSAIIADMLFPVCETLPYLEKIRRKYPNTHLPFLIYTDYALQVYRDWARKLGANDVYCEVQFDQRWLDRLQGLIRLKENMPSKKGRLSLRWKPVFSLKRAFDLGAALFGLMLTAPLWLLIVLAIRLESKGPVFYVAPRIGQGFRRFSLYKFRTMYVNADQQIEQLKHLNSYQAEKVAFNKECDACQKEGTACSPLLYHDGRVVCEHFLMQQKVHDAQAFRKFSNDPRITKVGNFLRRSSLDELPQLLNILKGDISLVGNRPLPPYEAEHLTYDEAVTRFKAPAGLTGLWQVTKRGKARLSAEERIALDNYYAQHHSFWLDLKIFFKTFRAVWQSEKA